MIRVRTSLAIAGAALLLTACNPVANLRDGDAQIERFHQLYSSGNVDALYAMTGPRFQEVTTRKQAQDLFEVVNSRLGSVKSSARQGFTVNTTGDGTVTNVTMDTKFAQGEGIETFVFFGNGSDMKLEGWHVNSDRLTITPEDIARERQAMGPNPSPSMAPGAQVPVVIVRAKPAGEIPQGNSGSHR